MGAARGSLPHRWQADRSGKESGDGVCLVRLGRKVDAEWFGDHGWLLDGRADAHAKELQSPSDSYEINAVVSVNRSAASCNDWLVVNDSPSRWAAS